MCAIGHRADRQPVLPCRVLDLREAVLHGDFLRFECAAELGGARIIFKVAKIGRVYDRVLDYQVVHVILKRVPPGKDALDARGVGRDNPNGREGDAKLGNGREHGIEPPLDCCAASRPQICDDDRIPSF